MARAGSRNSPPSENESGVTLTTPMIRAGIRLLRADQLTVDVELDEVMRLARAEALALIRGLIVDRLTRIVGHVRDPIGEGRKALGDAGARAQVDAGRLSLSKGVLGLVNRALRAARADVRTPAAAGGERQDEKSGNEEGTRTGRDRIDCPKYPLARAL